MKAWFLFALLGGFSHLSSAATLQQALKEYGIKVEGSAAGTVTKDQRQSGKSKSQHVIEAETPAKERFEIKIISGVESAVAAGLIESESTAIKKQFSAAQTPYMGDISQAIGGCPSKYGPLERSVSILEKESKALLGAVTEKLTFGACTPEDAKFKGAFLAYYDEGAKTVWTWRIFTPWSDAKTTLKSDWLKPLLSRFRK